MNLHMRCKNHCIFKLANPCALMERLLFFFFLKRKESGLWIHSTGLDSSSSMCSVTLSKLLNLSELCLLQLQNGTNPIPVTWLKPPYNTGLCKAESCENGLTCLPVVGELQLPDPGLSLDGLRQIGASSTPCSCRWLNMSFPLKKRESSFYRGVIIYLVLGEPVNETNYKTKKKV